MRKNCNQHGQHINLFIIINIAICNLLLLKFLCDKIIKIYKSMSLLVLKNNKKIKKLFIY